MHVVSLEIFDFRENAFVKKTGEVLALQMDTPPFPPQANTCKSRTYY